MGLIIPSEICEEEYENSRKITKESASKVILNEIQFQDNRASTAKIKNNMPNKENCKK